ncbi:MAG: hypothetical protein H0W62_12230 [Chitinophagales bacterium]|nr:hypothetical protein [Chitinophagales bacterium]
MNHRDYAGYTIITAGDKNRILNGTHIISYDFINIDEVLTIADVMICHGGNGTIYHGLGKGVYMLCLTSHFEQEWNVQALERIGYGKSMNDYEIKDWKEVINDAIKIKVPPYYG